MHMDKKQGHFNKPLFVSDVDSINSTLLIANFWIKVYVYMCFIHDCYSAPNLLSTHVTVRKYSGLPLLYLHSVWESQKCPQSF